MTGVSSMSTRSLSCSIALLAVALVMITSNATTTDDTGAARLSSTTTSFDGPSSTRFLAEAHDACLGLPRNTVLASCPAPCVDDAPCIVYDQSANGTKLTGCDFDRGFRGSSFCLTDPTQSCEFHCFGKASSDGMFRFALKPTPPGLEPTPRAPETPRLNEAMASASQYDEFVDSIGALNLSNSIRFVSISSDTKYVAVDTAILSRARAVTSFELSRFQLGSDRLAAIVASSPPTITELRFRDANLTTLSWEIFNSVPKLESLDLWGNSILFVSGADATVMPALTMLSMSSNQLDRFDLRAPQLYNLNLQDNRLVRIPDCIFTFTELKFLDLGNNPMIQPLVLTAQQVAFLEGLQSIAIALVDPPDQDIVSRLPTDGESIYGNYTDNVDLGGLLKGSKVTVLRRDPSLPVRIVDHDVATTYNSVLELRAKNRGEPRSKGNDSTPQPLILASCLDLPRNSLLASCPAPCLSDAPCIVYSQDANSSTLTGCDYETSSRNSFCSANPAETCELHCFAKSGSLGTFEFAVDAKAKTLKQRPRSDGLLGAAERRPTPYQSNDFVLSIGKLDVSDRIRRVGISGEIQQSSDSPITEVDVEPGFLSHAASVMSLTLQWLPLGSDRVATIIASAPSILIELSLYHTNLTTLSWKTFVPVPNLELLALDGNKISSISGANCTMAMLKELNLNGNSLTSFDLRAPKLVKLFLLDNQLVHIPESVFMYTELQILLIASNPIFRPLVLTAQQLQFLQGLLSFEISLVDPPDDGIVSRLPDNEKDIYGNYFDSVDLSVLLEGSQETLLEWDPLLPVRVVDSKTAAEYNNILEKRAKARGIPFVIPDIERHHVPPDLCQGIQRNTLLSNCVKGFCPTNGACVAYDQDDNKILPSGCDYDVASLRSACAISPGETETCEFHCFGTYQPQSQFKFFIPFQTELVDKMARKVIRSDLSTLTTKEIPFLSNAFVNKVGVLDLTSTVTEVMIAGGRSEKGSRGRVADVDVSHGFLRKIPSVVSLSLLNLDLSNSDLSAILSPSPPSLRSLNLRNTQLAAIPEDIFASNPHLQTLTLAQNELTVIDIRETTSSQLQTLDLRENALRRITIDAPNLKNLYLSGNNLEYIPPSVFSLTKLETLDLNDNPVISRLVLSPSRMEFLEAVPDLRLSPTASEKSFGGESAGANIDGLPTVPPGSTVSPRGYDDAVASLLAGGGKLSMLKDVPVIIVSEAVAKQYYDQLERNQEQASATSHPHLNSTASPLGSTTNANRSTEVSMNGTSSTTGSRLDSIGEKSGSLGLPNDIANSSRGSAHLDPSLTQDDRLTGETVRASKASGMSLATKLMLGGLGATFFVVVLLILVILQKRRSRQVNKAQALDYLAMANTIDETSAPRTQGSSTKIFMWWKDDVLRSHRLNAAAISNVRVISTGGESGTLLWLVNYRAGSRQLVSKRLIQGEGAAHDAKMLQLVTEAKIASTLEYPSIVRFVGVAWTDKTDLQVLYEYMPNGDLGSYLASTDVAALPWGREKLQFVIDIIEALVYTHSFNPPMLHRNLKASNVLLDDDFKAKLSDFASARPESESNTMTTSGVGSGRWLAPEILSGSTSYGTASDIYSFGVVLCELDTHQEPYAEEAVTIPETELLQRVARGDLRPSLSASCPPEIREIAEACLMFNPENRPNVMHIAHSLRSLMKTR